METKTYISPEITSVHLCPEGVLCSSTEFKLEDLDVRDGEWGW